MPRFGELSHELSPAFVRQVVLDDEGIDVRTARDPRASVTGRSRFEHTEGAAERPPHEMPRCDNRIHEKHKRRPIEGYVEIQHELPTPGRSACGSKSARKDAASYHSAQARPCIIST